MALALGQNDDGTLEYAGVYFYEQADKTIYVLKDYLQNGIVSYYDSFAALQSGSVSTMSEVDFNALYVLQGYISGGVTETGTVFESADIIMSHAYMDVTNRGLLWYLYYGVENVIYPPLIFLGIGAMTDFGPMIANPKSMLIGAAAQLGVFLTFLGAVLLGFDAAAAASIGIIGGADGPTAIYLTQALSSFTNMAKIMNKISGGKINPLIGSAGVSAVPMAARISEDVGREEDPSNHLLMHAMGPNVAGVIGSAVAAGFLLACFGG